MKQPNKPAPAGPVTVQAWKVPEYDPDVVVAYVGECIAIAEWCGGISRMMLQPAGVHGGPRIEIHSPSGVLVAHSGDYIIRDEQGRFRPWRPELSHLADALADVS